MVTTWLLTHGGSQVHSRGHKLGDRIQRTDVARTRLCCAAGTVPGVSLTSCSLTFAATIWEGGGISDVLPVKKNLGAVPPAPSHSGHPLQHVLQPALVPLSAGCLPFAFLTLVLLRGAAVQGCLHGGSSRWSSNPYFQSLWQVLWNLFPQDLAMWDLETEPHLAGSLLPL